MKIDHWLFLRGLAREQRHWAGFIKRFEDKMPNTKVHCLDLPGIGTEWDRQSPRSSSLIMDDIRHRWLSLSKEHSGNWGLFSISFGSMLALSWTSRYPQDFAGQVLINSSAANLSFPWLRLKPEALLSIAKMQLLNPEQRELEILKQTTNKPEESREKLAQANAAFALSRDKLAKVASAQLQAAISFRCPSEIKVPTLVLCSKGDRFTNYKCSLALSKKLQTSLEIHPTAGHDLPMDDSFWICEKMQFWMNFF